MRIFSHSPRSSDFADPLAVERPVPSSRAPEQTGCGFRIGPAGLRPARQGWRAGQWFAFELSAGGSGCEARLHGFDPDVKKILVESVRGAFSLGSSLGASAALYARALRVAALGRLDLPARSAAAAIPAIGAGATVISDTVSAKLLGRPTDPEGRSSSLLPWVSPAYSALMATAYRFAPIAKPRLGSVPDMIRQVSITASGGAAAYSTREWLAQRALAGRGLPPDDPAEVRPELPDRFLGRAATQAVSTALRWQALARPSRAPDLFFPVVITTCLPFGWREEFARRVAVLRGKAPDSSGQD